MKKAVVKVGGKQYVVAEKETLRVDLLPEGTKDLALDALLVIDGDKTTVGNPTVKGVKVKAKVVEAKVAGDKVRVIRYHSKKRVHTETGHRQKYSEIEIESIGKQQKSPPQVWGIFDAYVIIVINECGNWNNHRFINVNVARNGS